ncbi:MAG: hypothetical protein ABH871_04040 [Pseudomonadota bacterium]
MVTTTRRTTYTTKKIGTKGTTYTARTTDEILVVAKNVRGIFSKITAPLANNDINIECYTSYTWGDEVAFRLVTDNNKKAIDLFTAAGYNVQVHPVALWYTENTPGTLDKATTALDKAKIDTYSSYMTAVPNSSTVIVTFNTNNTTKTVNILNGVY